MISAILEFMTVALAVVAIRSVHTGLYLTITNRGELQGTVSLSPFFTANSKLSVLQYFSLNSQLNWGRQDVSFMQQMALTSFSLRGSWF